MPAAKRLSVEWDELAFERARQISSGEDLSFKYVLAPLALELAGLDEFHCVLDVGSGTGHLTSMFAQRAKVVLGIEPSSISNEIAAAHCPKNVSFVTMTLEQYALSSLEFRPTIVVAAMTLMTTPDLTLFAQSLAKLINIGIPFVATVPHPCFWPTYRGYNLAEWFDYGREIFIEAPFTLSRVITSFKTTHIHRPLEQYIKTFYDAGFDLELLKEPMPTKDVQDLYPAPWTTPRYIGFRWVRAR